MIVGGPNRAGAVTDRRPWTFYALGTLFVAYMAFLYGPMVVIYVLSFQGRMAESPSRWLARRWSGFPIS